MQAVKNKTNSKTEKKEIISLAIINGDYLKAPNGKESNLTPEQWITVRTKAFFEWFGDWLNDPASASKMLDENGEPLVYYHGTPKQFKEFDISHCGSNSGDKGNYGSGFYFSESPGYAKMYGSNLVCVFLSVKNILHLPGKIGWDLIHLLAQYPAMSELKITEEGKTVREFSQAIKDTEAQIEAGQYDEMLKSPQITVYSPTEQKPYLCGRLLCDKGYPLKTSDTVVIYDYIGSGNFSEAARKDGFQAIISGDEQICVLDASSIKPATYHRGEILPAVMQLNLIREFLDKYPINATCWSEATDEVRDMARTSRELLEEMEDVIIEPVDFPSLKTPSSWNRIGTGYIISNYARMKPSTRRAFFERYKHWFTGIDE